LISKIVDGLTARGIQSVLVPGDGGSNGASGDHPEFHADYDAFIAPHYEANVHAIGGIKIGGSFWGRAAASTTAGRDDQLGNLFWAKYSTLPGKPADHFEWNNANVTAYYGFNLTSNATPGILVEHGVGAPGAPDFQWLRDNVAAIAGVWVDTLAEFGAVAPGPQPVPARFRVFDTSRQYGVPSDAHPDTAEWAAIYAVEAPKAGIRAEVAFAHALKETGKFKFLRPDGTPPPSGYNASWNNPAGLGVTGAAGVGNRFPSKLEGARAHLQHLIWYLASTLHTATPYCTPLSDQRHFGEHKLLGNDVRLLDGKWAVPGVGYGDSIANIADALPVMTPPPPPLTPEQEAHRVYELAEAREPLVWIARLQRGLDVERGDTFDPNRPPLDPRIDKR
jgi:hypothetical protein